MIPKISKFLNFKIGNKKTDKMIEQIAVSAGGILFFILMVRKLSSMDISEFQLILGVMVAAIFMLIAAIYSGLIGHFKSK